MKSAATSEDPVPREVCFLHLLCRSRAHLGRALRGLALNIFSIKSATELLAKSLAARIKHLVLSGTAAQREPSFQQAAAFVWLFMRQPLSEPFGNTIMIARGKQTHQNKCK